MTPVEWSWHPASNLAYQGTCSLGTCIIIWADTRWVVWAIPAGTARRTRWDWEIPLGREWSEVVVEAGQWAYWALLESRELDSPHTEEEAQSDEEPDILACLGEWLRPLIHRLREMAQ